MKIKKNGKVINLTEGEIKKLSKLLLKEQSQEVGDLPDCSEYLIDPSNDPAGDPVVGGDFILDVDGDISIKANFTVSPQYQGYKVYVNERPFCRMK